MAPTHTLSLDEIVHVSDVGRVASFNLCQRVGTPLFQACKDAACTKAECLLISWFDRTARGLPELAGHMDGTAQAVLALRALSINDIEARRVFLDNSDALGATKRLINSIGRSAGAANIPPARASFAALAMP